MAFDKLNMAPTGASLTSEDIPTSWSYISSADNLATIRASAYFNDWAGQLSQNDYLYLTGSDGSDLVNVTSVTGASPVTVAAFISAGDIADGSVTTAKLAALAVTLAKLAPGITPSHVVKFADEIITTGGSATETFSVPGVLGTDLIFTQLQAEGSTPRTILVADTLTDQIRLVFSGDPAADHHFFYEVTRPAS